jgi:uncharacterized protein
MIKIKYFGYSFISIVLIWLLASGYLLTQSTAIVFNNQVSWAAVPNFGYKMSFHKTSNNQNFSIWELKNPSSDNYLLYLHGNAGRLVHFFPDLTTKFNVISPAYAGYSESEGEPSMENAFEIAEKTYNYMVNDLKISEDKITILGHSLGGSIATNLASKKSNAKQLVLINTFSSIQSMCFRQYTILCVFAGGVFNSAEYAKEVKIPVKHFAYKGDTTIPFEENQKLFSYFKGVSDDKKQFFEISGSTHAYPVFDEVLPKII